MKKAIAHGATRIELRMDSDLVVKQLNGEYQVKNAHMKPLWTELKGLLAGLCDNGGHSVAEKRKLEERSFKKGNDVAYSRGSTDHLHLTRR